MSQMLHGCLADTDYQVVRARSGHEYGVWVTTPPGYADSDDRLPLVYVVDGNWTVGLTAPLIVATADPFLSVKPYVQVTIGYAGDEAASWEHLRNRDLVPPGEPVDPSTVAALEMARETGAMTQEQVDAYVAALSDTRADAFLDFLSTELHPLVSTQVRASDHGHGLFGYSYGGLFSLYAWLRGGNPFEMFGAGSPGVVSTDSQVFDMVASLPDADDGSSAPHLHVTLNEVEMLGSIPVYRDLARHVLDVVHRLHGRGRGEQVSSATFHETHVTGLHASFMSFVTTCYQA